MKPLPFILLFFAALGSSCTTAEPPLGVHSPTRQATLNVAGTSLNLGLAGGISRADAEKILAALVAGKVRYRTASLAQDVARHGLVNFSRPREIGRLVDGKSFGAAFPTGLQSGVMLTFVLDQEGVLVTEMATWPL